MKTVGYIVLGSLVFVLTVPGLITGFREAIKEVKKKPSSINRGVLGTLILAALVIATYIIIVLIYA